MNDNTKFQPIPVGGRWCILRTSPGRTLGLMVALAAAGYEAWTPKQVQTRRRPRSKVTFELEVPIAPTFVFARAVHVRDLAAAEAMQVNPFPAFSLFRHEGRIPLIADGDVAGLRQAEERARVQASRQKRRKFVMGQRVRLVEGIGQGMVGTVEKGGDKFALVAFGSTFRMRIATWLLSVDDVEQKQPTMGAAA